MPRPPVRLSEQVIAEHERLFREGVGVSAACKAVRMSTATYYQWAETARENDALGEDGIFAEFFRRVVAPRQAARPAPARRKPTGRPPRKTRSDAGHARLTERESALDEEELVGLLEFEALDGNVRAIQLLLERPWEKKRADNNDEPAPVSRIDELAKRRAGRG